MQEIRRDRESRSGDPRARRSGRRPNAGNIGALDKVDRTKVKVWEEQFLKFMKEQKPEVRALLGKEKAMTDEVVKQLDAAIAEFQPQFRG